MRRRRVLILGGGPAGLSCAYQLSRTQALRERFQVSVVQMGWRLGGKGASGRNARYHHRIEEHGLHIMFGSYENFFSMIREVYDALGRKAGAPLSTWREAFIPHDTGTIQHCFDGVWRPLRVDLPPNEATPGTAPERIPAAEFLRGLARAGASLGFGVSALPPPVEAAAAQLFGVLERIAGLLGAAHGVIDAHAGPLLAAATWTERAVRAATSRASKLDPRVELGLIFCDFLAALIRGIVVDRALEPGGRARLDELDFTTWLVGHGLRTPHERCLPARFLYDAAFSFADGDATRPTLAAGTALFILARMGLTYKGSLFYKMKAGMGDTIVAPLYLALRERGVEFRFFQRLEALHLDPRRPRVASVQLEVQRELGAEYEPLIDVHGLPCWPSEPRIEGPFDAQGLERGAPSGGKTVRLASGSDFDDVVLATPIGTLPSVAAQLIDRFDPWRDMASRVQSVQTQSVQLWLTRDLPALGFTGPSPLSSLHALPLSTWCDMSLTLDHERWPAGEGPAHVSYFTGPQAGPTRAPATELASFESRMRADAAAEAMTFVDEQLPTLWPRASRAGGGFDWALLHDPEQRSGRERMRAQYVRSNAGPSERCTIAAPGTNRFRMRSEATGVENLVIAGDWTDNGYQAACMEGATVSGLRAASAIAGEPLFERGRPE